MEGSSGEEKKDGVNNENKSGGDCLKGEMGKSGGGGGGGGLEQEKSILVLSALYYLYGEDLSRPADWVDVAKLIESQEIPIYGEGLSASICKSVYENLFKNGIPVRLGNGPAIPVPTNVNEIQQRRWMLFFLSNDLRACSMVNEKKLAGMIKDAAEKLVQVQRADYQLTSVDQELLTSVLAETNNEDGEVQENVDGQGSPEDNVLATETALWSCMQDLVGLHDCLKLVKFCENAVEQACRAVPAMIRDDLYFRGDKPAPNIEGENSKEILEPSKLDEEKGSGATTPILSAVGSDTPTKEDASAVSSPVRNKSPIKSTQSPTEPKTRSHLQSPTKSPAKDTCSETSTVALESTEKNAVTVNDTKASEDHLASRSSPSKKQNEKDVQPTQAINKDNNTSETTTEKADPKESVDTLNSGEKEGETKTKADLSIGNEAVEKAVETKNDEPIASGQPSEVPKAVEEAGSENTVAELESAVKGKPGKKSQGTRSKRTSSRLTSPEPTAPSNAEDKSTRRTRGRHGSSSSELYLQGLPALRSRRVATPTGTATEKEAVSTLETKNGLLDSGPADELELPETPDDHGKETSETKDDTGDKIDEVVKPKNVKVYSAKPPSPLSQVDPKIFDDFNEDEDDPELTMIDSGTTIKGKVEKIPTEKASPVKASSRKGRTMSSDTSVDPVEPKTNEETASKRLTRRGAPHETEGTTESATTDDNAQKKRPTRSSLKIQDSASDDGWDKSSRAGSEKSVTTDSSVGKEKKSKPAVAATAAKKGTHDEKTRSNTGSDLDELSEEKEKRLTRARAKTSTGGPSEKRSKPSEQEVNETEPVLPRTTRSRTSTSIHIPVVEPTTPQPAQIDDEESKAFKKKALEIVEKIMAHENTNVLQKFSDDPEKIIKQAHPISLSEIKSKVEGGQIRNQVSLTKDLSSVAMNILFAHPDTMQVKDGVTHYFKMMKTYLEGQEQTTPIAQKVDMSDVESHESHDESRNEGTPKASSAPLSRRNRKRSASETSEDIILSVNKRRVTRTSVNTTPIHPTTRKPKHPISPDIVHLQMNRSRH